jgi:hypothetical protein
MAGAAIRVYYSLPSERRDRLKLLASCSYALVLLLLLAEQIPSNSYVAGPIPRHQSAVVQRMWKINQASADYADKFGGVYPFDLAALETQGPRPQSDCKASGLLDRGFDENKVWLPDRIQVGLSVRHGNSRLRRVKDLRDHGTPHSAGEDRTTKLRHG